jgi:uncharacterized protein HemX
MPEFRAPRIRMPRVSLPGRSGGAGAKKATASKEATASKAKTEEVPKAGNGPKPAPTTAKTPVAKGTAPEANLQERMEGLQGWMAEIERKQGRITYFGIAGLLIAIIAAGAALYFGLTAKSDSATKSNVDALSKRIDSLEAAATKNSKDTQEALNASVTQLQQSISAIQKQQSENAASISTLQSQAAASALGKGAGAGAGATGLGAGLTPGSTTTTPNGK